MNRKRWLYWFVAVMATQYFNGHVLSSFFPAVQTGTLFGANILLTIAECSALGLVCAVVGHSPGVIVLTVFWIALTVDDTGALIGHASGYKPEGNGGLGVLLGLNTVAAALVLLWLLGCVQESSYSPEGQQLKR